MLLRGSLLPPYGSSRVESCELLPHADLVAPAVIAEASITSLKEKKECTLRQRP
jgi:hypothetical protein